MTEQISPRNRIHIDVWVPHDQAEARIAAAIAAGGHLVTDQYVPAWWVLADAEGNEACVATWMGRDGACLPCNGPSLSGSASDNSGQVGHAGILTPAPMRCRTLIERHRLKCDPQSLHAARLTAPVAPYARQAAV
jgi:hypothetical protein